MKWVPNSVTRAIATTSLKAKHNSPHIFFVGGVIGVCASTVMACRATLKLEDKLDDIKTDIEKTRASKGSMFREGTAEYNRDMFFTYVKAAKELGILYGPSIIVGTASIAAITNSHIQLTRRNAALTAAYAGLSQVFDEYRERVREELGEERERDIYMNAHETTITDADGKKIKAKVVDGLPNEHARIFSRATSANWKPHPDYNRYFLQQNQNYFNEILVVKGHVLLNDVYDMLGFDRTSAGAILGWSVNSEKGEGYISFGLDDGFNLRTDDSIEHGNFLLDFNIEGIVYDMI